MTLDQVLALPTSTLSLIRDLGLTPEDVARRTEIAELMRAAEKYFGITWHELNQAATCEVARMRFAVMWALRRKEFTLKEIAGCLGMLDHSSVVYGLNRARESEEIRNDGEELLAMLADSEEKSEAA